MSTVFPTYDSLLAVNFGYLHVNLCNKYFNDLLYFVLFGAVDLGMLY